MNLIKVTEYVKKTWKTLILVFPVAFKNKLEFYHGKTW